MLKFLNNWSTVLTEGVTTGSTTLSVYPADGEKLTGLGSDAFYRLTVEADGQFEILDVSASEGGVLTVLRAQEGTVARDWPAGTGVYMRITAGGLDALRSGSSWGSIGGSLADQTDLAEALASLVAQTTFDQLIERINQLEARLAALESSAIDPNSLADANGNLLTDADNTVLTAGATA